MQLLAAPEDGRARVQRALRQGCLGRALRRTALRVCLSLVLLAPLLAQYRGPAEQLTVEKLRASRVAARAAQPRRMQLEQTEQGAVVQQAPGAAGSEDCPTEVGLSIPPVQNVAKAHVTCGSFVCHSNPLAWRCCGILQDCGAWLPSPPCSWTSFGSAAALSSLWSRPSPRQKRDQAAARPSGECSLALKPPLRLSCYLSFELLDLLMCMPPCLLPCCSPRPTTLPCRVAPARTIRCGTSAQLPEVHVQYSTDASEYHAMLASIHSALRNSAAPGRLRFHLTIPHAADEQELCSRLLCGLRRCANVLQAQQSRASGVLGVNAKLAAGHCNAGCTSKAPCPPSYCTGLHPATSALWQRCGATRQGACRSGRAWGRCGQRACQVSSSP